MKRGLLAAALVTAIFGCSETDPNKINNDGITGDAPVNPPTKQTYSGPAAPPGGMPAPGAPGTTGQGPAPAATEPKTPAETPGTPETPKPADDTPKTAAVTLTEEELAEVKKLPEAEQALAIAQAVCPISAEHLGSMGVPVKVEHEGKTAYLCCEHCKTDFDADPAAAMAKLSK
jgi:YHS domain-containing protein